MFSQYVVTPVIDERVSRFVVLNIVYVSGRLHTDFGHKRTTNQPYCESMVKADIEGHYRAE